jgi:hypothetical protein
VRLEEWLAVASGSDSCCVEARRSLRRRLRPWGGGDVGVEMRRRGLEEVVGMSSVAGRAWLSQSNSEASLNLSARSSHCSDDALLVSGLDSANCVF